MTRLAFRGLSVFGPLHWCEAPTFLLSSRLPNADTFAAARSLRVSPLPSLSLRGDGLLSARGRSRAFEGRSSAADGAAPAG